MLRIRKTKTTCRLFTQNDHTSKTFLRSNELQQLTSIIPKPIDDSRKRQTTTTTTTTLNIFNKDRAIRCEISSKTDLQRYHLALDSQRLHPGFHFSRQTVEKAQRLFIAAEANPVVDVDRNRLAHFARVDGTLVFAPAELSVENSRKG